MEEANKVKQTTIMFTSQYSLSKCSKIQNFLISLFTNACDWCNNNKQVVQPYEFTYSPRHTIVQLVSNLHP